MLFVFRVFDEKQKKIVLHNIIYSNLKGLKMWMQKMTVLTTVLHLYYNILHQNKCKNIFNKKHSDIRSINHKELKGN